MGKEFDKALVAHSISNAVKYRTSRQNSVYQMWNQYCQHKFTFCKLIYFLFPFALYHLKLYFSPFILSFRQLLRPFSIQAALSHTCNYVVQTIKKVTSLEILKYIIIYQSNVKKSKIYKPITMIWLKISKLKIVEPLCVWFYISCVRYNGDFLPITFNKLTFSQISQKCELDFLE